MDGTCVYEEKTALHELTQGIQMAEQLRANLHSAEARDLLMQKILSAYDNALFVLKSRDTAPAPALPAASPPESLISSGSPGSEGFNSSLPYVLRCKISSFIFLLGHRKGSTTWEEQVRIFSGNGLEDDIDDGYNWRKYGQKEILGAKFPRSYYRCSYRNVQQCMAKKQVQKTDADPTVFEITYKGRHTCSHGAQLASRAPPQPPTLPENNEITLTHQQQQLSPPNPGETLLNLIAKLSVDTTVLGDDTLASPIFSLPSTSSRRMDDLDQLHFPNYYDDELWQVYSPPPPTLPEKNEITPTHHHQQISPPNPGETLSNLRANLSVDTTVLGGDSTLASPIFSLPSTSSGLMDELDQFHFISPATSETNFFYDDNELWHVYSPPSISPATSNTNFPYYDNELWQVYSSPFISPATSETNFPCYDNELRQVYSPPFISSANSETNFPCYDNELRQVYSSPFISPATSSETNFPCYDNELRQVYSPPFISQATSETHIFREWGSSPSLDLLAGPADVDPCFEFTNSLL
ncbi:hypothetical protein SSX86_001432 [Deinandra increscens subsp. villosa]|uniref:WRKY domain-containing protein n=1 Tax=Deinandra increscens subsp. villosa TaxID=3103831 RepID=A0AAP0DRL9_9ASTR